MVTVTQGHWNVGTCHSSARPGVYVFQPFRVVHESPWKSARGDAYGREFASSEAASAFALDHGYTQVYRSRYALGRRVHRAELARIAETFRSMLHHCFAWDDVRLLVRSCSNEVSEVFGDVLAGSHWACGFWDAARALRPDLFPLRDLPSVGSRVRLLRDVTVFARDLELKADTVATVLWVAASKWVSGPVMRVVLASGVELNVARDSVFSDDDVLGLNDFAPIIGEG